MTDKEDDGKRINFVVPKELYERFMEYSRGEYKTTSGMLTSYMAGFVQKKEQEEEQAIINALLSTIKRCSEILYTLSTNPLSIEIRQEIEQELSDALLSMSKEASICKSVDFQTVIVKLERMAKKSIV
jgi:hypothetical protein